MPLTAESAARKDKTQGAGATLEHRHFAFIAATLAITKPPHAVLGKRDKYVEQWEDSVLIFAGACERTNPKFDRKRFLIAAGMIS